MKVQGKNGVILELLQGHEEITTNSIVVAGTGYYGSL